MAEAEVDADRGVAASGDLPRLLGPWTAMSVIVGSVIGSGIFLVPAKVAADVPYLSGILAVWILGGLFSLAGALTLAELASALPRAGGPYVYLGAAYGPTPAFLFGWAEFLVIRAGSMATIAAAFAQYALAFLPIPSGMSADVAIPLIAAAAIAALVTVNALGTRHGGRVQVVGTILKVGSLLAMIALPFAVGAADPANLRPWFPDSGAPLGTAAIVGGLLTAMVGVLWTYDGWISLGSVAEEIRDPGRNIPRALALGSLTLIALYVGVTVAYHLTLPIPEMAALVSPSNTERVGVAALFWDRLAGAPGALAISAIVTVSTLIALNGNVLTGPRAYFAMARDGAFPEPIARLHPTRRTPANAIILQGAWAIALLTIGSAAVLLAPEPAPGSPPPKPLYDILYTYVIFGATLFYTLAIAGVFVLRRTRPDLPRPFKVPGYPFTPALFILAATLLMLNMLRVSPVESLAGLFLIAMGLPARRIFRAWGMIPAKPRGNSTPD